MAMNGNQMGAEVITAIKGIVDAGLDRNDSHEDIWKAICTAIVTHIQNNAVVIQPNDSNGDTEAPGTVT